MKDYNGEIQYKDKIYKIVFNLNVMEAIQDRYGTLERWGGLTDGTDGEPQMSAVLFGFTEMLNEGIDIDNEENGTETPFLTQKQVGRILSQIGLDEVAQQMNETIINSAGGNESEPKNA